MNETEKLQHMSRVLDEAKRNPKRGIRELAALATVPGFEFNPELAARMVADIEHNPEPPRAQHRASRDALTAALRDLLANMLDRKADKLGDTLGSLRDEADRLTIENLAEWLDRGGWEKVDGDEVEARLVRAARATAEADSLEGITGFVWERPDAPLMLIYDLPRSPDTATPKDAATIFGPPKIPLRVAAEIRFLLARTRHTLSLLDVVFSQGELADKWEQLSANSAKSWTKGPPQTESDAAIMRTPEGWELPAGATVLVGLDALRAGMKAHDWGCLAACLGWPAALDLPAPAPEIDWLRKLAAAWLNESSNKAADRAEHQKNAVSLTLQTRNLITADSTGADFLRFPSMLKDAAAWCGALVEVDGDTIFADEPNLAAAPVRVVTTTDGDVQLYKPRAWTVAAEHRLKGPQQPAFPGILTDPPHNPDLGAYLAVTATGAAVLDRLPGLCAKLLPLLFALCPLDGTAVAGPVQDLVKLVYPDWKTRRKMNPSKKDPGDVARVGAAVAALLGLRIVEAVPGKGLRFYPVLHCDRFDAPRLAEDVPETCLRLNPSLAALATPEKGKGNFVLVNLSRLMELDAKSPDRIAVALRLAAYWHTCKQRAAAGRVFLPERLDYLPVDALLVESNAPGMVADVIAGADRGRTGKVKLSEARRRLVDATLPALVDAGLLGIFSLRRPDRHAGRGAGDWLVKVPPPKDYLEASKRTAGKPPATPKDRAGRETQTRRRG